MIYIESKPKELIGSVKVPYGGFKKNPVKISLMEEDSNNLPLAHTW